MPVPRVRKMIDSFGRYKRRKSSWAFDFQPVVEHLDVNIHIAKAVFYTTSEYPDTAWYEAVVNAVCHRSYRSCDLTTCSTAGISFGAGPSTHMSFTALKRSPVPSSSPSNRKNRTLAPGKCRAGSLASRS